MTDEEIKVLKAKYRKVVKVTLKDDSDKYEAYFKRPDMETIAAVSKVGKTDEIKAANILFDNCFVGGDQMVKEDAVVKMAAIGQLKNLMTGCTAETKNL